MKGLPIALLPLGLALGGCMQEWRPEPVATGPCRVTEEARMRFAGARFHDVRRGAIERATNSRIARVVRPDEMMTMDFREDRLTIRLDQTGHISGLTCG